MADKFNSLAAKEKAFLEMAATLAALFNDLQHDLSDFRDYAIIASLFKRLDCAINILQWIPSEIETIRNCFPLEGGADA